MTENPEGKENKSLSQPEVEKMVERAKEELQDLRELIELDFFGVGDRYSFEQNIQGPTKVHPQLGDLMPGDGYWRSLVGEQRRFFLSQMGFLLGTDLLNIQEDKVIRNYHEEGVVGTSSEGGASVRVLQTKFPELEIHVLEYKNPELGTRYDLVRSK